MAQTTILRQYINVAQYKKAFSLSSPVGWINRFALAIVYLWFGFFKIIHQSPAQELVANLHKVTFVHYIPFNTFLIGLGVVECFIGILFLFPKVTKLAFLIFALHITTTFLPLFCLPDETWKGSLILTLPGQYIVKNLVLVASAVTVLFDYRRKMKRASKKA